MKRMLFNATHAEELRVAIVDGQKLVDIDIEAAGHESRKSNIYKGVITRVEPSLEACFVSYGEERHGFLPFKEVSRMYFRDGVDVRTARIQDALKEGQELLVQLEKEERGNKGAALTTFVSLAGRYLVLMPNNPKGGGVSRRIEGEDRNELRDKMDQLQLPGGMSVIARTAAIDRTVEELQWDCNYLMQLWKAVDDASRSAPGAYLIYQESSLVIRAIRDYFQPEIGEILIDTDDIYEQAKQFMAHVMPDMVNRVKRYRDETPLYSRFQIEHQIESAYSRTVQLPSGGSIVIDHTEALVAVDVNSARSTRGSDIEETATRTNLEAAEEAARQLRLRDLGGLIVIDFIDMEEGKNQKAVENKLRDALHFDRARVQMGKISKFGLMELSRQRLRPALSEASHVTCPRCTGTGVIRDTESTALHVLRIIQEEAMKDNTSAIHAQVPVDVATYLLNEKRIDIAKLEARHRITVTLIPNKHIETPHYKLERLKHDDARLEEPVATYQMADAPEEVDYLTTAAEKDERPRQIAKVKGIVPTQPAPSRPMAADLDDVAVAEAPPLRMPPAAPAAPRAKPGFFAKLFGWMAPSKPEPVVAPAPKLSQTAAKTENARTDGGRGGRSSGRDGRDGRNSRDGAEGGSASSERSDRGGRNRGGRGGRDRNSRGDKPVQLADTQPIEALQAQKEDTAADENRRPERSDRNERGERGERGRRSDRPRSERGDRGDRPPRDQAEGAERALATPVVSAPPPDSVAMADMGVAADMAALPVEGTAGPDGQVNAQEQERRRRRRGGRRGRGRGEGGEGTEGRSEGEEAADQNVDVGLSADAPLAHPEQVAAAPEMPVQAPAAAVAALGATVAASVAASVATSVAASDAAPASAFSHGPDTASRPPATPFAASLALDGANGSASIAGQEPVAVETQLAAQPAFRKVAVSLPQAAPAKLDIPALESTVQTAGLAWVHTDADKHAQVQQSIASAPRGSHVPRARKPAPALSSEPLVLVETRQEFRAN